MQNSNIAGVTLNDLLGSLANNFPAVESDVVAKAIAAASLRTLIQAGTRSIRDSALTLKSLNTQVAKAEKNLYGLDRTVQFMITTGNPLPFYKFTGDLQAANRFCSQLGIEVPEADDAAWSVPDGLGFGIGLLAEAVAEPTEVVKTLVEGDAAPAA